MNIVYNQSCSKVAKNAQFAIFLELYFVKSVTNYQKVMILPTVNDYARTFT